MIVDKTTIKFRVIKRTKIEASYPARGSLTILCRRITVSMLWAKTSSPEWTKVDTASKSPRKSEVRHSTNISGLNLCTGHISAYWTTGFHDSESPTSFINTSSNYASYITLVRYFKRFVWGEKRNGVWTFIALTVSAKWPLPPSGRSSRSTLVNTI